MLFGSYKLYTVKLKYIRTKFGNMIQREPKAVVSNNGHSVTLYAHKMCADSTTESRLIMFIKEWNQ